jgi:hypothetical protein
MSKNRLIITPVILQGRFRAAVARAYDVSKGVLYKNHATNRKSAIAALA